MSIQVIATEGELFLTEKEMEGKSLPKSTAAKIMGTTAQNLYQMIKAKKVKVEKNGEISLAETVRWYRYFSSKQRAA